VKELLRPEARNLSFVGRNAHAGSGSVLHGIAVHRGAGSEVHARSHRFASDAYAEPPIGVIGSGAGKAGDREAVGKPQSVRAQMRAQRDRYESKLAADALQQEIDRAGENIRSRPRYADRYMESLSHTAVDAGAHGPFGGEVRQGGNSDRHAIAVRTGSSVNTSSEADRRRRSARQRKLPGTSVFPDKPIQASTNEV